MRGQRGGRSARRCPPKRDLGERRLMAGTKARGLAELFGVLADPTRLRLLHALARDGEKCVTDLASALRMKPQAVSNQLRRLAGRGILASRRDGTRVWYRIADPCVPGLLDTGWCLAEDSERRAR